MVQQGFPASFVGASPDRSVVHARRLEPDRLVDFDGLVWFEQSAGDDPEHCSVFFGARQDDGSWTGRRVDVPKGRRCDVEQLSAAADGAVLRAGADAWTIADAPPPHGPIAAGFEARDEGPLGGTWRGEDGDAYYLRHLPSGELWFFAEHPGARVPWARVFRGTDSGGTIAGTWADVRGSMGAGTLRLRPRTPTELEIVDVTGGFRGRALWRVQTLDVTVQAHELTIVAGEESADDPLLYLHFYKLDGDALDEAALADGDPVLHHAGPAFLGHDVRGPVAVPPAQGRWSTTLATIRSGRGRDTTAQTQLGVQAFAIEVDDASYEDFRERRYRVWCDGQRFAITSALRHDELPTADWLRRNANRMLSRFLGPWEGWPWGDPDDSLSGDVAAATFADLREHGTLERVLQFRGAKAHYRLRVTFTASPRID